MDFLGRHILQLFGVKPSTSRHKSQVIWIYLGRNKFQLLGDKPGTSRQKTQVFWIFLGTSRHNLQLFGEK